MKRTHRQGGRIALAIAVGTVALAVAGQPAVAHPPGVTERVSVSTAGVAGDDDSIHAAVSGDGRYVAFVSSHTNLVKGDRNDTVDVFVRDRVAGTTERVNMASRKIRANSDSSNPAITSGGRFVAFDSFADNLVPGDTNFTSDVFVVDRSAGVPAPQRVRLTSTGEQPNNSSSVPSISADGRFVAFTSSADGMVPGDTDGASDVFVRDRVAGTTEGISVAPTPSGFDNTSTSPAITPDGRYVAFSSWEDNLVPGDTNNSFDIFVRDRSTGGLERVSLSDAGVQGDDWSLGPAISSDGNLVAFSSLAKNLVAGDNNFDFDVFVRDRAAGTTVRASVRTDGTEGGLSLASFNVAMNADGKVLAFASEADLVATDTGFRRRLHSRALTPVADSRRRTCTGWVGPAVDDWGLAGETRRRLPRGFGSMSPTRPVPPAQDGQLPAQAAGRGRSQLMARAMHTWRPSGAYDNNYNQLSQNTVQSDIRLATAAWISSKRTRDVVTLTGTSLLYSTGSNNYFKRSAKGAF
jgi:Tol biopolymer transport system component